MKVFAISVLATAALVALAAPHKDATPGYGTHSPGQAKTQLAHATQPEWYGGEMVLDRAGDGHFYASVDVDSRDYRMLVDTGASVVALTGDDARDMGLDWDPNALSQVARGASGPVMGVPVTIADMAVGDFEARDVRAVIVPDGLAISLLGQSFLRHVPKVDIAGDTLTLSN